MTNQKDILTKVFVRLRGKYSEKEIEYVSDHIFETLRYYLSNPELCKKGIHLQGFIDFRIRINRMLKILEKAESGEKTYPERLIESFKQCTKNTNNEKRKTSKQKDDERSDESES